MCYSN